MANGFGSLYVGSSGLRSAQNGLNVIANNLANVDTKGYVRQQVVFEDQNYNRFDFAAIGDQKAGLGVGIGEVVHLRDQFIDRAYRTTQGREDFYDTCYEATQEVETLLRELTGAGYSDTINNLYEAMAEFGKIPSDTANQSVLVQTASLFLSQTKAIYESINDYQVNLNGKIRDDVNRINEIARDIYKLNIAISRVENAGVETAMDLRDERDLLIDELSSLGSIDYEENYLGQVQIKLEGTYLVTDARYYTLATRTEDKTGFLYPYWEQLSEPEKNEYYDVFRIVGIDPTKKNDVGQLKALLLTRGDHVANYTDIKGLDSYHYNQLLSRSVAMNTQAEFDMFVNNVVTSINELLSPTTELKNVPEGEGLTLPMEIDDPLHKGKKITITENTKVLDTNNAVSGKDGRVPPYELFERTGCERFSYVDLGNGVSFYLYNEEKVGDDLDDLSECYSINSIHLTEEIDKDPTNLPYKYANGDIAYDMGERFATIWDDKDYHINPDDVTPTTFTGFYVKLVGDLSNKGSVYRSTSKTLNQAVQSIEDSRQGVIGVSSDEELTTMIKFQNAYNASSRYMTVVSQMIEHLVTSLGA